MGVNRQKWREEYSRWFDWVIEEAEIYDYGRYPVKGMGVWRPYGFQIRRRVLEVLRELLDNSGHEEILLPLLIPEDLLRRESEHVKGFEAEVYWVTRGGDEELDVKLALRPTSETNLSYMESFWIKSYRDLPKKFYQIVSIFRYETKATRPMIRLREVTTFKEAHTVHDSFEDADRQVGEAIDVYKKFFDYLGIPYVISRRPEWDKFAGALYTVAFDTIMPDGKTLQIGTAHHLGQNFTIPFEIRFQLPDETLDYAWQTSYGVSDRVIATLISIHGDDRGTILPPNIAPIQVVIIPLPAKTEEENRRVKNYVSLVTETLEKLGVRFRVDDREEVRPGRKFYEWELRGVPIRIEIGLREVHDKTITLARRDTLEKITIPFDKLGEYLPSLFKQVEENLRERAWRWMKSNIRRAADIEDAKKIVEEEKGIVEVPWCGVVECGIKIEEEIGAKMLGTPIDDVKLGEDTKCIRCSKKAVTIARLARQY